MSHTLEITAAQYTDKGTKEENQDFHALYKPEGPALKTKGAVIAIADGMSGSESGREASEACVSGFINDYYSTPDSWSVKNSAHKVLTSLNRWLYSKGQMTNAGKYGLVTTFSAIVIKSTTAYLLHVGDSRIYRLRGGELKQLTRDHRIWVSESKNYLNRALGIDVHLDVDYKAVPLEINDLLLFTTDGIHDFLNNEKILETLLASPEDLDHAASELIRLSLENNSNDNLTSQLVRIDDLPVQEADDVYHELTALPMPPELEPGNILDGYRILKEIHASKRSQCYLAVDQETDTRLVIKTPSVNYEDDADYLESFHLEEWVGRRLNSNHVIKVLDQSRKRQFLYHAMEYVEGQTLRQWMNDNPLAAISHVRQIIEQLTEGLRAFHRLEMVHRDLKPENIMIDKYGVLKIIDFGSTKITGIEEIQTPIDRNNIAGTINYTAPEIFEGDSGSMKSDLYSVALIAYEMLTGKLPFKKTLIQRGGKKREYVSIKTYNDSIPAWVDGAISKALQYDPDKRYDVMTEFVYDLSHPNAEFTKTDFIPLLERNPVGFWKAFALISLVVNLWLLFRLFA